MSRKTNFATLAAVFHTVSDTSMSSFTTSTPARKMFTMQIKRGQLEQHTQCSFLNGTLTQLMSLTQGFSPPTVQVKAVLTLFEALFQ